MDGPGPPALDAGPRRRLLRLLLPLGPLLPGAAGPLPPSSSPPPSASLSRGRTSGRSWPPGRRVLLVALLTARGFADFQREPPPNVETERTQRPLHPLAGDRRRAAVPADDALRPRARPGAGPADARGRPPRSTLGRAAGHRARPPPARERLPGRAPKASRPPCARIARGGRYDRHDRAPTYHRTRSRRRAARPSPAAPSARACSWARANIRTSRPWPPPWRPPAPRWSPWPCAG